MPLPVQEHHVDRTVAADQVQAGQLDGGQEVQLDRLAVRLVIGCLMEAGDPDVDLRRAAATAALQSGRATEITAVISASYPWLAGCLPLWSQRIATPCHSMPLHGTIHPGGVAERLNAPVLKTGRGLCSLAGSNPAPTVSGRRRSAPRFVFASGVGWEAREAAALVTWIMIFRGVNRSTGFAETVVKCRRRFSGELFRKTGIERNDWGVTPSDSACPVHGGSMMLATGVRYRCELSRCRMT